MPADPADKGRRPVVVVSVDWRNHNPRANSVLVVPLSTTPGRGPLKIELPPGETGLGETSTVNPDGISAIPKTWLEPPRTPLRRLSESRLRQIAAGVQIALGLPSSHSS
jgi:mRNA-degrading endonuclease toxin of MazEF toxin-antitoxin module